KMLLPRKELDAHGNEIDPRHELVDKILEYKRFKEAAATMALMEADRLLQQKRGNIRKELDELGHVYAEGTEVQTVSLYKLMSTFERVMKRFKDRHEKPQHVVVKYNYSQEGQRAYLIEQMRTKRKASFEALFSICENRIHAIFTFLAMLELVQQKYLAILIGSGRNNFILEWNEHQETMPEDENRPDSDVPNE